MITIYAEKPDMGTKIAAALDAIHLKDGRDITFSELEKYESAIKYQRSKDGCFKIRCYNEDVVVTWGYGHMAGLKQATDYDPEYSDWTKIPLPFIPETYELRITASDSYQMNRIKRFFFSSRMLICATDNDREGDLIFDYIYSILNCHTPFKRAIYNQQSKEEFQKAFRWDNLIDQKDRINVIKAGRARSAGDFIVGTGPTVAMTLKHNVKGRKPLSIGRVQTAVLNMIVSRELEIQTFKPQDYWTIKGKFSTSDGESYIGYHKIKRFDKQEEADLINRKLAGFNGNVMSVKEVKSKKNKPFLYSLVSLQMDSNKAFGFSLEKTLEIAQSLYEKGLTTYPRTDATCLPEDMHAEMQKVFQMLQETNYAGLIPENPVNYYTKQYFDNSKIESHYAIVPTKKVPGGMTQDEAKVYDLIVRSVLTMLYPSATMSKTTIVTEVNGEEFISHGMSVVDPGYMSVTGVPRDKLLPNVTDQELVKAECSLETKKTEPPKRYTDASLVNAMVNCGKTIDDEELKELMSKGQDGKPRGLGRPSSQASILTTLASRDYIKRDGKTIIPSSRGINLIKVLPVDDLKSAVMTAEWEKRLDNIEKGTESYETFMRDLEDSVRYWTSQILNSEDTGVSFQSETEAGLNCPFCGKPMRVFSWGLGCTGYSDKSCSFGVSNPYNGKKLSDVMLKELITKGRTKEISGFIKKSDKSKYSGALHINKQTKRVEFVPREHKDPVHTNIPCPKCGKALIRTGWGYECSEITTGCNFTLGTVCTKRLTGEQMKLLLNGQTVAVKGMRSNKGKSFVAEVYIAQDGEEKGKIKFKKYL